MKKEGIESDELPPVKEGYVRLYRGQQGEYPPASDEPRGGKSDQGRWFTTDKDAASFYGPVRYVDVPKEIAEASREEEGTLYPKSGRLLPSEWANKATSIPDRGFTRGDGTFMTREEAKADLEKESEVKAAWENIVRERGGEPETETLHSEDLNEAVRRVEYAKESAAKIAEAEPPTDPWEKLATGIEKAEAPAKAPEIDQKILRDIRYRLKYAHEIEAPVAGIDAWLEAVESGGAERIANEPDLPSTLQALNSAITKRERAMEAEKTAPIDPWEKLAAKEDERAKTVERMAAMLRDRSPNFTKAGSLKSAGKILDE